MREYMIRHTFGGESRRKENTQGSSLDCMSVCVCVFVYASTRVCDVQIKLVRQLLAT